jgi:hypothetical protein
MENLAGLILMQIMHFKSSMFCKSVSVLSFLLSNSSIKRRVSSALCVYFLPEKLRSDSSSTDKNRDALTALFFGNLSKGQKKIAYNALENLKNGDKLKHLVDKFQFCHLI